LTDERSEALPLRNRKAVLFAIQLEAQRHLADSQQATVAESGLIDVDPVHERSISALEIAHAHTVVLDPDLTVKPRDRRILDDQIVELVESDRAAAGLRLPDRPGLWSFENGQAETPYRWRGVGG